LFTLLSVCTVNAQGTTVRAQPSKTSPKNGETFTVDITISNVQNLFAVDVSLTWNNAIIRSMSASPQLGVESHPGGVLHETVYIAENSLSQPTGTYHLYATSEGATTAAFSGSGKIVTLTFQVLQAGHSQLMLETELADKPASGQNANLITHTDLSSSVDTVVPEFSTVFTLAVFFILATAALVFSKKRFRSNTVSARPAAKFQAASCRFFKPCLAAISKVKIII
jgi:hypothetical protein